MLYETIKPVPLRSACRLLGYGPTVLVSARHAGVVNVMAAAWGCVLDFSPPRLTVVLDKQACTRHLVERSGEFALLMLLASQAAMVYYLGHQGGEGGG